MTSHAAVVARGMGRPCVAGAAELRVDYRSQRMFARDREVAKGEIVTMDGSTGEVMLGSVATIQPQVSGDFATLMGWADSIRRLRVRTNAETPLDAETAVRYGAEGIGLCRTEHMFFEADRIIAVREMIMAEDEAGRRRALAKILPMQRQDFESLFRIMAGLPVTIRLLDPPLHEFLPHTDADIDEVARASGKTVDQVKHRAVQLHESNPMLGHRGCRLGISYPEIYEMQARAIFEAAAVVAKDTGTPVVPEVMIPLVATRKELALMKEVVDRAAAEVAEPAATLEYLVGTMIELPRAALRAGDIAEVADFFSFGTNDLTQTTFGISRDDAGAFLGAYQSAASCEKDPFVSLDIEGVGELVEIAAERGRKTRPDLKLGICGEHGGDPGVGDVLPRGRPRLCLLLALPRADRPAGGGAGGARRPASRARRRRCCVTAAHAGVLERLRRFRFPARRVSELPRRDRVRAVVVVETALRLAAEPAGFDILHQQRAGAVLAVGQAVVQHLHHRQTDVEADEVGELQRAHRVVGAEPHARCRSHSTSSRRPRTACRPPRSPSAAGCG